MPEGLASNRPEGLAGAWAHPVPGPREPEADGVINRMLFEGEAGGIGEFRCPPGCRAWERENRIGDKATIAFARDPVAIAQGGALAVVATPNEAMLYNANQPYRRRLIDANGDRCEFFVFRPRLLAEIVSAHDPRAGEDLDTPLKWPSARASASVYMAQRVLYHHVRAGYPANPGGGIDRLLVDECMINIADALIGSAVRARQTRARRPATDRDHRVWIEGAKDFLARSFRRAITLNEVGDAVGLSVFHLCRLFKAHAGTSVHGYLRSLRARAALEVLGDRDVPIGRIASDLGFCNQSHFTRAFGHEFGATPSQVRRALRVGLAERELLDPRDDLAGSQPDDVAPEPGDN